MRDLDSLDLSVDLRDYSSRVEHVRSEIAKVSGVRLGRKESFIRCPYHNDRTPSGRVKHDPVHGYAAGSFFCFGCKEKKKWNELAEVLSLEPFGDATVPDTVPKETYLSYYDEELLQKGPHFDHSDPNKRYVELDLFEAAEKANIPKTWRTFSLKFLHRVCGASIWYDLWKERYLVHLPVMVQGVKKGHINARTSKPTDKSEPSYLNKGGEWSRRFGLFPYDYAISLMRELETTTVVLVEGPRDALRLLRYGIPAMSILGTNSWSKTKSQLLEFAGVTRVILAMDGDQAGKIATYGSETHEGLLPLLEERFDVKNLKLWERAAADGVDKYDPCDMPKDLIAKIKGNLK